jgi:hypothetical protein
VQNEWEIKDKLNRSKNTLSLYSDGSSSSSSATSTMLMPVMMADKKTKKKRIFIGLAAVIACLKQLPDR